MKATATNYSDSRAIATAAELIHQLRDRLKISDGDMPEGALQTLVEALAHDLANAPPPVVTCPACGVAVV